MTGADMLGLTLTGVATGLVTSLLGLGGGLVIVPALTLWVGFAQREAVATSVVVAFVVSVANVVGFQLRGLIAWSLIPRMAFGATVTAALAALALTRFAEGTASLLFFVICLYFGVVAWTGRGLPRLWRSSSSLGQISLGAAGGMATGLGGVGGGMIYVPVLSSASWISQERVVPSMAAMTFVATLSSAVTFSSASELIHWPEALVISAVALLVSFIGRRHQQRLSTTLRRRLVGAIIAAAALRALVGVIS
jgi:hypothetical protein